MNLADQPTRMLPSKIMGHTNSTDDDILPPPVNKQMSVCLAALQHLIQTQPALSEALAAYLYIRGARLSFAQVLKDTKARATLATALNVYPAQSDEMINDMADCAKYQLAALIGHSPRYIHASPATSDSEY